MIVAAGLAGMETAHGAGECGRVPVDQVALKLAPCAAATQNPRARVPPSCCAQVRGIGRNPKCLCAVMLSDTARKAGVKPAVAMTIPKRCAIANRPVGYKCGRMHPFPCCDPQAFFVERKMDDAFHRHRLLYSVLFTVCFFTVQHIPCHERP
jgi:hypothetical protein